MAPGHGDASMAGYLQTPWKIWDLNRVLAELQVSGSIHFHKTLARSQSRKFGQCEQLILPLWFMEEHADKFEELAILRTFSSPKPWRVRLSVFRKPSGSPEVKFVGGWKQFATRNRLKESDTLVFVLNEDARSEFQVYIFRGPGRSSSNSQSPARKRSNNSDGAKISEETEKGTNGDRHNLSSDGNENIRKTGDFFTEKKKAVQERQQNLGDSSSGLESDHAQASGPGCGVEQKSGAASEVFTGSECNGLTPQHRANSLPSFWRRLLANKDNDPHNRMEVPACFVKTHGMPQQLQDDVKLHGIHPESPVRIVTCYWKRQNEKMSRLYFKAGWREFVIENGLQIGQELQFKLTSDSFFAVRVV